MVQDYIDEGVIILSEAIIDAAKENYEAHLSAGNYIQARISAVTDSKGIVGDICAFATGDREFLVKDVEKRISS